MAEEEAVAATAGTPAAAPGIPSTSAASRLQPAPPQPQAAQSREAAWRDTVLPALVGVLLQKRGAALQESKEASAGIVAKYAANGPRFAAEAG